MYRVVRREKAESGRISETGNGGFKARYVKDTGRSDRGSKWSLDLVILSNFRE